MPLRPTKPLDLDLELDRFALRSFREIADHDYISARLSSRARLPSQFLWQAQQAIEKYFKFILLIHRIKAPKILHDLKACQNLLEQQLPFALDLTDTTREFVKYINGWGAGDIWRVRSLSWVLNCISWTKPYGKSVAIANGDLPEPKTGRLSRLIATVGWRT